MGRNTQGVRLREPAPPSEGELLPDQVAGVTRVVREDVVAAEVGEPGNGGETKG